MRVSLARKIDLHCGFLLCLGLRLLDVVSMFGGKRRATPPQAPRAILAIKCFGFGSILQMCPMLAALKEAHPDARITLLTFAQNAGVARLLPMIDDVATVEFRKGILVFLAETMRQILRLRRQRFDIIFDCEFFSYYVALITRLLRTTHTVCIGFFNNRRVRDWIFTHMIAIDVSQHISRLFLKMLAPLGVPATYRPLPECGIRPGPGAAARVDALLESEKLRADDLLVVANVNASDLCPNRRWPLDHFERLIREMLSAEPYGVQLVVALIGAGEESGYVDGLARRFPDRRVRNLAGRLSIEELAALMRRAVLFIGNDSGPLHLAVACGMPTVSFFGPETPKLYGPVGENHHVFYRELHCSPCLNLFYSKDTRCTNNVCLKTISPEDVFPVVDDLLRRAPARRAGAGEALEGASCSES